MWWNNSRALNLYASNQCLIPGIIYNFQTKPVIPEYKAGSKLWTQQRMTSPLKWITQKMLIIAKQTLLMRNNKFSYSPVTYSVNLKAESITADKKGLGL